MAGEAARAADADIVDVAVAAGDFKTLRSRPQSGRLGRYFERSGPVYRLCATDAAFAKLPAGTVETLLKPENKEQLTAVLTYHVVPGKIMAADAAKASEAKTVNGAPLKIAASGDKVTINDETLLRRTSLPQTA